MKVGKIAVMALMVSGCGSANTSFAHVAVNTNPEMTRLEGFERITNKEYAQLEMKK